MDYGDLYGNSHDEVDVRLSQIQLRREYLLVLKNDHSLGVDELNLFRFFKKETEAAWAQMDVEERRHIQEQVASESEGLNDSGVVATDYYRRRMRYSHVIFLTSVLESAMRRECNRLACILGGEAASKWNEIKSGSWGIRRNFIERYGKFQIQDNLWGPIRDLLDVRNALVHEAGDVRLLKQEQISKLSKISGIRIDDLEVEIEVGYINHAIVAVDDVMSFCMTRINNLID